MSLKIYNTLSRQIEDFEPLTPPQVKMYCCGPTVYDFLHVGNFRGAVFYNLLRNHLENSGYQVTYVYNFTDIDDKIIARAAKENTTAKEIAEKYIAEFRKDFDALGLRPHSINPKVTESLDSIIEVISKLIENGKAYVVEGEVFYSIESFSDYGKLSGRDPEQLLEGARKEVDPKKRNAMDFSLWKPTKEGEQSFDSPWGKGRPGWHIECTAMIHKHLGPEIDIHGGGLDLLFPHHENEIAQAEGCCESSHYVKYWVHNNMFTFSGTKMSKSLGNVRTMRSFLEEYPAEIFKFIVLSAHYRSETDFSDRAIQKAMEGLSRVYSALALAQSKADNPKINASCTGEAKSFEDFIKNKKTEIKEALDQDFSTPKVFSIFFEVVRDFNQKIKMQQKLTPEKKEIALILLEFFKEQAKTFCLFQESDYKGFLMEMDQILIAKIGIQEQEIEARIAARAEAKRAKNYELADKIRNELLKHHISLMDSPEGTSWEVDKASFFESKN